MTKAEIIEILIDMITEAGYDYHDYSMADTADQLIDRHSDRIEFGEIAEGTPFALPDTATLWEWISDNARDENSPCLYHLAEAA